MRPMRRLDESGAGGRRCCWPPLLGATRQRRGPGRDATGPPAHGCEAQRARRGADGGGIPGVFKPPEDTERPCPTLPPGTIAVDLRDADDKPVAGEVITLGMMINSIAKGDSRKHLQAHDRRVGPRRLQRARDRQQRRVPRQLRLPGRGLRGDALPAAAGQDDARRPARVPRHVATCRRRSS